MRGQWLELAESVSHDVTATVRLARWMGILPAAVTLDARPAGASGVEVSGAAV